MASFDYSEVNSLSRTIPLTLYTKSAIAEAKTAFFEYCRVSTIEVENNRVQVSVMPLITNPNEIRTMFLEFWNYVLDRSCQEKLR